MKTLVLRAAVAFLAAGSLRLSPAIAQPCSNPPLVDSVRVTAAGCGAADGAITIVAGGGAPPLRYSIDFTDFRESNTLSGLRGGDVFFAVRDAAGCEVRGEVFLPGQLPRIRDVAISSTPCDRTDGGITIVADRGTGPLRYSFDGGLTFQSENETSGLPAGPYRLLVRDSVGCEAGRNAFVTSVGAPRFNTIVATGTTCGRNNARLEVIGVSGGTGTPRFSIDGERFQEDSRFDSLPPGRYVVTIRDEKGCLDTSGVIDIPPSMPGPVLEVTAVTPAFCGQATGSVELQGRGGSGTLRYALDTLAFQQDTLFRSLAGGVYTARVQDRAGCADSVAVTVPGFAAPLIESVDASPAACGAADGGVTVRASGGAGRLAFALAGGRPQPEGIFTSLARGSYELDVRDEAGCAVRDSVFVPQARCTLYLPNAFTPNGDGINDTFRAFAAGDAGIRVTMFRIFDRWGNLLHQQLDLPADAAAWDGAFRGRPLPPGTFLYFLEVAFEKEDSSEVYTGAVHLIR